MAWWRGGRYRLFCVAEMRATPQSVPGSVRCRACASDRSYSCVTVCVTSRSLPSCSLRRGSMVESLKVVSVLLVTGLVVECRMHVQVHLKVPRYVLLGSHVLLKCEYNVEKDQLHKVEWLKHGHKIFQFVNGRKPPFRNFTIHGAQIDWAQSNEQQVRLKILDFDASGVYSCEVTTETPIYTKASEDEEVTVIKKQIEDPTITYYKTEYTVGERLEVNCTSGQSRPTPEVTWLLNGKQADEQWIRTFPEQRPSSVTVQLSLEVREEHVPELELTCLSTIPGFMGHHVRHTDYADHRRYVLRVGVVAPEPIISADSLGSSPSESPLLILVVLLVLLDRRTPRRI